MRTLLILNNEADKTRAKEWIDKAPKWSEITFKGPRRTLPQNAKLHAMIGEIAAQVPYHGVRLSVDDWKLIFLDALKREIRMVPNLDGTGFVNLGKKTSKLSTAEMATMLDLVVAWGDQNGVVFHGERPKADGIRWSDVRQVDGS